MKSTAKAQAWMRDLSDKLSKRFAGGAGLNTVRAANDANGWPMLFLSNGGTETEGSAVVALRITAVDAVSKDVFGNALTAMSPHILEVAYELTSTSNKPCPALADIHVCEFEAYKLGIRTQIKEIANASAVTEANMNSTAATVDIEDLYWPTKGQ